MHLVGDDQRRHRKGRSSSEKFFKRANMLILAVQLACFLITLSLVLIAAGRTYEGSFIFPSDYLLAEVLDAKTRNCSFNASLTVEGYPNVPITLNYNNQGRIFTETASEIRFAFAVYIAALALGAANKLVFDVNKYSLAIRHLVIHKEILTSIELILLGFTYQQCFRCEGRSSLLVAYLHHCGVTETVTMYHQVPFVALYVGNSVVIFFHLVSFVILIYNSLFAKKLGGIPDHDTPEGQLRSAKAVEELQMQEEMQQYNTQHMQYFPSAGENQQYAQDGGVYSSA